MAEISWAVSNIVRGGKRRSTFNSFGIPRTKLSGTGIRDGMILPLKVTGPRFQWAGKVAISSGEEVFLRAPQEAALRRAMQGERRRLWDFVLTLPQQRNGGTAPARGSAPISRLTPGTVYTRDDLRARFGIKDATLNNGVFPFPSRKEVWLFVTQDKPRDRTPYRDLLTEDELKWQGQTAGRTDHLITNHVENGNRLLVFYRRRKYEFPGAGFRFEGEFTYERHRGARPTNFLLQRISPKRILPDDLGNEEPFNPKNVQDGRQKILRAIRQRRGQQKFRALLLDAYDGKCAFTGCSVLAVLEAAHIFPYMGAATNKVTNGILLRADLHTLFDSGLVKVDPDKRTIMIDRALMKSEYRKLHGRKVTGTRRPGQQPSKAALIAHRDKGLLQAE